MKNFNEWIENKNHSQLTGHEINLDHIRNLMNMIDNENLSWKEKATTLEKIALRARELADHLNNTHKYWLDINQPH